MAIAVSFPPDGPTTQTAVIPSYLYQEYSDDDTLQAFVQAFNGLAQNYIDTFNALNLPVYTNDIISGALLDWVGAGLYGMPRPALASGQPALIGPLNTWQLNTIPLNTSILISPDVVATSDDIYKRILTWHLFKGDGKVFNIRWLKRRIMRFLIGVNGSNPNIDQTYQVSVTFGVGGQVSIRLIDGIRIIKTAALLNTQTLNSFQLNDIETSFTPLLPLRDTVIFKDAVLSGALELPFQFSYTVTI